MSTITLGKTSLSKTATPPLHLEWTPTWVRATNFATGETESASRLDQIGSVVRGQSHVLVGVGHGSVFVKSVRLPKAAPHDLRNILSIQLGQLFPLPPEQLSFDFIQTDDQTADGWLTVVGAIRSEDLIKIRTELKQAGLTSVRVLPISLASGAVAARAGLKDGLVVERGNAGLSLDVVRNGILIFSRLASASADIGVEVQRTLAAARAGKLPVIADGPVDFLPAHTSPITELSALGEAPAFNFELPEDRSRAAKKHASGRMRLAALMVASALLLVLLVATDRQDAAAKVKRSEGAWARQLTTLNSIANTETDTLSKTTAVQTTLTRAFEPAQPLSDIAAVVADSTPQGAWLNALTVERGKPLEIRGTAKTSDQVTRLIDALGASPRFRDVRLVFANSATVGATPVVQFNISAVCVGNLPMPTPVKAGRGSAPTTGQTTGAGG